MQQHVNTPHYYIHVQHTHRRHSLFILHFIHSYRTHMRHDRFTINSDILTYLSLSSSIEWYNSEEILMTGSTGSESIVGISDIDTVSTGDECWFIICHIVDEN